MVNELAYSLIAGKPVIMYLGIITLLSFLTTALLGYINLKRGINKNLLHWHLIMAITSISLAVIHGIFGLSSYFNF